MTFNIKIIKPDEAINASGEKTVATQISNKYHERLFSFNNIYYIHAKVKKCIPYSRKSLKTKKTTGTIMNEREIDITTNLAIFLVNIFRFRSFIVIVRIKTYCRKYLPPGRYSIYVWL